jgi:hypothetical protein
MLTIRSYSKSHVLIFSVVLTINIKEKDKKYISVAAKKNSF